MTEPRCLRSMLRKDLPAVMEIDRESLPRPWSEAVWREELQSPFSLCLVLEEGGAVCGYISVQRVDDEAHVLTLAVSPGRRQRGFGQALVEAALAELSLVGVRRLFLEVRPSNLEACALYDSLGFMQTGMRPRYYGDEDALLMTLDL